MTVYGLDQEFRDEIMDTRPLPPKSDDILTLVANAQLRFITNEFQFRMARRNFISLPACRYIAWYFQALRQHREQCVVEHKERFQISLLITSLSTFDLVR